jgi:hypothetical protein
MFIISIFYAVNRIGSFRKRFTLNPDLPMFFAARNKAVASVPPE